MKAKLKQSGLTLTEMTVTVAIVALLGALSTPAIRTFFDSMASSGSTRAMISAAMASARAIAAREQKYVGIRFQTAYDENGPLEASQYMIYIVHDYKKMGLVNGFRAVEGLEPIRLPDGIGVMDLHVRKSLTNEANSEDRRIALDTDIDDDYELRDTKAFSIIFSPAGKLVIHKVRVRNRDGDPTPDNPDDSRDDTFNSIINIRDNDTGMFLQDQYADMGLGQEYSRRSFVIYDRRDFRNVPSDSRYTDFIEHLEDKFMIYINPYTGLMMENYVQSN